MGYSLGNRSLQKLQGVHPDLVAVVSRAIRITNQDFSVIEGLRSKSRQRELVNSGASQTMNSRHLTGHAVDIVPYGVSDIWDWDYYWDIEEAMKTAAHELNVDLDWGGDWRSFKDGPHWELSWNSYG